MAWHEEGGVAVGDGQQVSVERGVGLDAAPHHLHEVGAADGADLHSVQGDQHHKAVLLG